MNHLLVIPDGDRRYADELGLPRETAYLKAKEIVRELANFLLVEREIPEFTFFGLSYANIKKREGHDLKPILSVQEMALREYTEDPLFHENEIKISVYGEKHLLPKSYQRAINSAVTATEKYNKKRFNLLLGYSGALDLTHAARQTAAKNKYFDFDDILRNCDLHAPIDAMIRTAGEKRLSDGPFYLMRYTEFETIPTFFPALKMRDVDLAIENLENRKRTYGK